MSENDFTGKLAAGLRRTRQSSPPASNAGTPLSHASATGDRGASGARYARQGDQSPPASLDSPWDNLHPERIWPD